VLPALGLYWPPGQEVQKVANGALVKFEYLPMAQVKHWLLSELKYSPETQVTVGAGEGFGVGKCDGTNVGEGVGKGDGVGVGIGDGTNVGERVGKGDGTGVGKLEIDGTNVGETVGKGDGAGVGKLEIDGTEVGERVGKGDGSWVGFGHSETMEEAVVEAVAPPKVFPLPERSALLPPIQSEYRLGASV
jgi:hypothetical protein